MSERCFKSQLLHDMKTIGFDMIQDHLSEIAEQGIKEILHSWELIYGAGPEHVIQQLITDLQKQYKEFWDQQSTKLEEIKEEFAKKIEFAGREAMILEKALGLKEKVSKVSHDGPLVKIEEQLHTLLKSYQDVKKERLEEYFRMQRKEQELSSVLDLKTPKYKLLAPNNDTANKENVLLGQCYVPTLEDMVEFKDRIKSLEQQKEQLEYDFEETKGQLRQLLEECDIVPLTKAERFAFDETELPVTKKNFKLLMESRNTYMKKKEDMMAESELLREQITRLHRQMFKNMNELEEFLEVNRGYTEPVINKLKDKLEELKEERRHSLKELIERLRTHIRELWTKCCYSEDQCNTFAAGKTNRRTEEILGLHEIEVENLEHYYGKHKKIFDLAGQHEELWNRLLQLEEQANNKERLFNNRGGCLLKEEKERKLIQKKVPAIKAQLMELLEAYKAETGNDFLYFGEPLEQVIKMKEHKREFLKHNERLQRKMANAENVMMETQSGTRPPQGNKRKAVMTPQDSNRIKTMRTETISSASSASSASGTLVQKEQVSNTPHLTVPMTSVVAHTPRRNRIPVASTPKNGSLSYESFQEHIEKSKFMTHNSTRNLDQKRVVRSNNLNQTRTILEKRTPKTPGKTFLKTPTKTPSKIPFRIPTGSKIPSQVPPVSPRKPGKNVLSTTKLPIIF